MDWQQRSGHVIISPVHFSPAKKSMPYWGHSPAGFPAFYVTPSLCSTLYIYIYTMFTIMYLMSEKIINLNLNLNLLLVGNETNVMATGLSWYLIYE